MTESENCRAVIYSSFILYMIDNLLPPQDKAKGSVIRLKQALRAKTVSPKHLRFVELSNEIWADTINHFKDRNMRLVVGDTIEMLVYDDIAPFEAMYGKRIFDFVGAASVKVTDSGVSKEVIAEGREIVSFLISQTRKVCYDALKGKE